MKILNFDTKRGIYNFEVSSIDTNFHTHPSFEFILSINHSFILETNSNRHEDVRFAIIEPNIYHKIESVNSILEILMIECSSKALINIFKKHKLKTSEGYFIKNDEDINKYKEIFLEVKENESECSYDIRICKCLRYLNSYSVEFANLMKDLKLISNLSESRLSHLFKEEVGISIKRYYVWSNLKRTFQEVVNKKSSMYEASLRNNFYDQAHLSRSFKKMFGLAPSVSYNSRTVQVHKDEPL